MGKKFSELERTSSLNNGDLFAVAQVDAQAQTGYKSKSTEASAVAQKLLKGIEFSTDLQTDDKTVLGAINEVNSRTIAYDVVSGPVANFKTSLELPIKSLEIDVNAVQESGTPSPQSPKTITGKSVVSIIKSNKNLLFLPFVYYSQASDNLEDMFFIKAGTYRFSFSDSTASTWRVGLKMKDANGNDLSDSAYKPNSGMTWRSTINAWLGGLDSTTKNITISIVEDCYIRLIFGLAQTTSETVFSDVLLELGSINTSYEPFNGTTVAIDLGGTYYGGHFTQDKAGHRQFEVTSRIASYTGESGEAWSMFTVAQGNLFRIQASDRKDGYITESNCKCNSYRPIAQAQRTNGTVSGVGLQLDFINNDFSSVEDWKTNLADNPIQIVYELATPYVIDLPDGEPIVTLNGTNNIYADSGDASVEYALTIEEYINKKIAEVQALILNS